MSCTWRDLDFVQISFTPESLRSGQNLGLGERRTRKGLGWCSEDGSDFVRVNNKQIIETCFSTIILKLNCVML